MAVMTSTHGQLVINGKAVRDRDAMLASIAPEFSPSTPYEAGEYVIHDSEIRKFKEGGHAAGAWSDSDNDPATIDDVIGDITTSIDDKGVQVPDGTKLCEMPGYIGQIGRGGDLPSGYELLAGITNGTSQYAAINNKFTLNVETSDEIGFEIFATNNFSGTYPELDFIDAYPTRHLGVLLNSNYQYFTNAPIVVNSQYNIVGYVYKNSAIKISQKGGILKYNGIEYTVSSNTGTQNQSLSKFFTIAGNYPQQIVINNLFVKNSAGNYKYKLVPCLDKQNNQKGLFDLVHQQFFYLPNYQS